MNSVNAILNFFAGLSTIEATFWLFVQNVLQFVMCVLGGHTILMLFRKRTIVEPPPALSNKQILLACLCVVLNTMVAVAGWFLWKRGIIQIKMNIDCFILVDMLILLVVMDFLMYVSHRIAHFSMIFPLIHSTHHLEEHPRPLSLFVLSPMEVFGYGSLWLVVIAVYHSSWLGIVLYLLLNATFGTLGHLGVEPFPKQWLSIPLLGHLTTSTFHAQHHTNGNENFGFYTDIWDRLFGTLSKTYRELFETAASKTVLDKGL